MSTPKTSRPDPSASSNWHVKLREILENYFDENDIETLCFDLRLDYESLEGQGKTRKIVELIKEFAHQGRIGELIDYCSKQRPNIGWAELREAALKNPLVVERQPDVARAELREAALKTPPVERRPDVVRAETKAVPPTQPPARKSSRWLFAAIALIAVALILRALWPHESPPGPGPAGSCGGTDFAGACWYFGPENAPCDAVCMPHGGYNAATRAFAGSDGSAGSCQKLLDALKIPLDNFFPTTQGGLGCFAIQTTSGGYYGYWDQDPTQPGATSSTAGRRRLCACQN